MPLLNNKPLQLHKYSKRLPDDREVFYCEYTNEIFEDYETYCQRILACNSLIWTCAMTGKADLTYQEALASESAALKTIKDFPIDLRTPLLYLASRVKCTHFNELADKVFTFAKDRYFLGETVEALFDDCVGISTWSYAHVLQVLLPSKEECDKFMNERRISGISTRPYPAALYKYELEKLDDDPDIGEVRILTARQVRRIRGVYTKDKNRTYLKQFAESEKGSCIIQACILNKYSINTIRFSNLFVGESPLFDSPKRSLSPKKISPSKLTQQSMKKFLVSQTSPEKMQVKSPKSKDAAKKASSRKLIEIAGKIQKKYQDTIDKVVQQSRKDAKKQQQLAEKAKKLEEQRKVRERERAEKAKLADFVKEWQRKREDLECEDLKELPAACPVDCRIPNEYFGEFVMILELFSTFGEVLNIKDYFPFGLKIEILERALVDNEIAGPLSDILQALLATLFKLQVDEDDEMQSKRSQDYISMDVAEDGNLSMAEAVKLATVAANWTKVHYGGPLRGLSLDAITLSEVLRLHLLSSGGETSDRSARWRYQERGGYMSTDDPGLLFRIEQPHILRALALKTVAELPVVDKLKILSCLMNQVLTYARVRDIVDDKCEEVRVGRNELKIDQLAESKKERELTAQKLKEKREAKERGEKVIAETEEAKLKQEKETKKKTMEFQKRAMELQEAAMKTQALSLGQDRAHRRFWIFSSIPGLFVEDDERWPGDCLPEPTCKKLINLEEDTMSYVRKLFEEERHGGSDKENEGDSGDPRSSAKKKLLGECNAVVRSPGLMKSPSKDDSLQGQNRLLCTASQDTCPVHGNLPGHTTWSFYYKETDVDNLIDCLNKRGFREHRLRKTLIELKPIIVKNLSKCPVRQLNRFVPHLTELQPTVKSTRSCKGYENANLNYPADTPIEEILELYIRELVLDTEEKIFFGGLGSLKVWERKAWRMALESRTYDKQTESLTWPTKPLAKVKKVILKEDVPSRPDTPSSVISYDHNDSDAFESKTEQNPMVRDIASAVLQIGRSIEPKYLKKPLPYEEKQRDDKLTAMERWEMSLMASTSLSQVYLHLDTLDSSVQWNKSALNARCSICRRSKDGENMLLCDGCNRGFHLYCLKPKLMAIPKGDWYCTVCRPPEPTKKPPRSRRLFREEESEGDDEPVQGTKKQVREEPTQNKSERRRGQSTEVQGEGRSKRVRRYDSSDEPLANMVQTSGRAARRKRRFVSDDSTEEPLAKMARSSRRSLRT